MLFVVLVPSDFKKVVIILRRLSKQTQLEEQTLSLAYDTSKYARYAQSFHDKVNGIGTVMVLERQTTRQLLDDTNQKEWHP